MNQSFTFLDARAREAEAEAGRATLDNVRERAMRSATTWRTMADKALKVESDRARAEVERLARKADELAMEQASHTGQDDAALDDIGFDETGQDQGSHYSHAAE